MFRKPVNSKDADTMLKQGDGVVQSTDTTSD